MWWVFFKYINNFLAQKLTCPVLNIFHLNLIARLLWTLFLSTRVLTNHPFLREICALPSYTCTERHYSLLHHCADSILPGVHIMALWNNTWIQSSSLELQLWGTGQSRIAGKTEFFLLKVPFDFQNNHCFQNMQGTHASIVYYLNLFIHIGDSQSECESTFPLPVWAGFSSKSSSHKKHNCHPLLEYTTLLVFSVEFKHYWQAIINDLSLWFQIFLFSHFLWLYYILRNLEQEVMGTFRRTLWWRLCRSSKVNEANKNFVWEEYEYFRSERRQRNVLFLRGNGMKGVLKKKGN